MKLRSILCSTLLLSSVVAQTVVFPSDYGAVPEGPLSSPNLPLARGVSRVMCLYEASQLDIPIGQQITALGFREDGGTVAMDVGRSLQLEVRIGYTTNYTESMSNNFDNNYASAPVAVFGPALFQLPNLRDWTAPLANGEFSIPLTVPFTYDPAPGQNLLVEYRVFGTSGGGGQFTYRLDRADYYSPVVSGAVGCQHSGGDTASLTVSPTRPGLNYVCQMNDGPANSVGLLAVSIGQQLVAPYPLTSVFGGISPTCEAQLSPLSLTTIGGATSAGGNESWYFQVPNNNLFANMPISSQALLLDFFAPGGVVVSDAAQVTTGLRPRSATLAATGGPTVVTTGLVTAHYCPVAFFSHQ